MLAFAAFFFFIQDALTRKSTPQRPFQVKNAGNVSPEKDILHHGDLLHCPFACYAIVIPDLVDTDDFAENRRKTVEESFAQILRERRRRTEFRSLIHC